MKIIDLFSGAGGLSLGFENCGFETVLAIDKWKDAIETFNFNHKEKIGSTIDIHKFTNNDILKYKRDVIGIIGGPPCQGFSLVGTRDTNDPRNSLYIEYVRFVDQIRPKFFVLENVSGLLSLEKGLFKDDILERFNNLGYNVEYKLLTASDYGVPQSRKRVFFVGLRKDIFNDIYFNFDNLPKANIISTQEAMSDLPKAVNHKNLIEYKTKATNDFQRRMRKNSKGLLNHEITNHTQKTIEIISQVPDGGGIKDLPEELYKIRNYNNAFRRMNSKLPSNTIDCGHRNYFHYEENRVPTVRESARIQSFPDTYVFRGSKTSQYTQVGNAVPPLLSEIIASEIKKLITN
ncbi:DNA cytosine methyltransferase [Staphylococcus epidermidis]|uniref:DNA cytosine methyltransferase n=1 Tax=Staphylococcus epidermidis TaxID=1282 RepID=UPI00066B7366|nr:DNA cytosine methyltransferase [Staphylococcus epidermidis]KAB2174512.1 DNA cytosine methyltransferase [Staphylococcus epidermidis]MCG1532934.1 DNA cytosine methyltransferase [Staphylococcus epidermidis]MCG1758908.1 DNA cytosine methyltransferase [Staphylococcus epidermidis]MCG1804068.1 DNA cytosine methyltransferase [Staphylococcus epidermidis]MCG1839319.1 DNA cytosine methyltransferase [Staphylococcus epidermidis]